MVSLCTVISWILYVFPRLSSYERWNFIFVFRFDSRCIKFEFNLNSIAYQFSHECPLGNACDHGWFVDESKYQVQRFLIVLPAFDRDGTLANGVNTLLGVQKLKHKWDWLKIISMFIFTWIFSLSSFYSKSNKQNKTVKASLNKLTTISLLWTLQSTL